MSDPFWPLALGGLGAIIGSFLATVAIRWPAGESALAGRSRCDGCGRVLRARDLVPLASFLWARGRARCCGAAIDPLHLKVEAAAAIVGITAGIVLPEPAGIVVAAFGWLLLLIAALDATELWIPDALTGAAALGGVCAALVLPPALDERLIGGAAGFASLWAVAFGYRRLRGREGLGGADPKLFGAIGLWLGWRMLPPVLLLAALIGLGIVAFRVATGRRVAADDALPFGAYLALAAYPALLAMLWLGP